MSVFRLDLSRRILVVDIEHAMVVVAARLAATAKFLDQRVLAFPILIAPTVDGIAVSVPVGATTSIRTKPVSATLAALRAFAGLAPAVREVARLITEFSRAFAQAVSVHGCGLFTVLANDLNWRGSHASKYIRPNNRKYFDIACERIENAQRQARLFA